ncbi:hypothetical protein [Pseudomonas sp. DP-17]|uniref:hypothetical protein n=1 Tax=Pseudomonas sp. DP-17 TaxID=1580486 RepID=UPI001EFA343D|nr:hypothetical protein [Pseudomonas sp. DP-17]MCG8907317.1 hypothetical protein [Pseudomonas sp. DP-17]
MTEQKHSPCPFCGGEVDPTGWLRGDGVRGPECDGCGATAPSMEVWEQRAALAQPSPAPELERPEVVAWCTESGGYTEDRRVAEQRNASGLGPYRPLVSLEQHDRIVGALRFERQQMDRACTACINELDAAQALADALAVQVLKLGGSLGFARPGEKMEHAPVAQAGQVPEEWRDMLANLQWHYRDHDDHWHRPQGYYCPQCGGEQSAGHKDGCELAALLAAAPAQGGE